MSRKVEVFIQGLRISSTYNVADLIEGIAKTLTLDNPTHKNAPKKLIARGYKPDQSNCEAVDEDGKLHYIIVDKIIDSDDGND